MKRFLLILSAASVILINQAIAQITINTDDLPTIGLQVIRAVDNTTQISPGDPGLNQVWDFTNLVPSTYDTILYLPPQGQPNHLNYPEAQVAIRHLNGNLQPYWDYEYARYDGQGMRYVGDEDMVTIFGEYTMSIHIMCNPHPLGLRLPFTYGDSYTQQSIYEWLLASHNAGVLMDSIKQISHMDITTTGDAAGIISTPYGSYPALRVKDEIISQDSVFNWTPNGWVFDRVEVNNYSNFKWYTNDYYEIGNYRIDAEKGNSMTFFKSETIVGTHSNPVARHLNVFPNPASNEVTISIANPVDRVEIFDMTGRLNLLDHKKTTLDVSSLLPGIYLIRVSTKDGTMNSTMIKQ